MSYNYTSLEQVLEQAAYRLPPRILGMLVQQVEDIITTNADGTPLERKIHAMIHEYVTGQPLFSVKRLEKEEELAAAAAA